MNLLTTEGRKRVKPKCETCWAEVDSTIGLSLNGPMVCQPCFRIYKREPGEFVRVVFERWVNIGTRHLLYSLVKTASGEYASDYTELAWKAWKQGWSRKLEGVQP